MATQKRQASVLGSTLTSLTLNSDLSSTEEETSEDDDIEEVDHTKDSEKSSDGTGSENEEKGKKKVPDKEVSKKTKPKVRMKTLTIDGQLVYFCVLCDKVFTRRKDKLNHELAHSTSETVLTCTECGKEYFHESSLAYHMRSHDGDQLHLCDLCPKMFAQGHHLKSHVLSHSQPTEFTCKTCYQDFALASDLSEHVRNKIKEELTTHWCKMCKVYFCRNHNEVKIINRNRLHAHQCTACNELFYSNKKLRLHMKKFAHKSFNKPKVLEPLTEEEIISQKRIGLNKREHNNISRQTSSVSVKDTIGNKHDLEDDNEKSKPYPKRRRLSSKFYVTDGINSSSSIQDSAPESKKLPDFTLKSPSKGRKGKPYCKKCNKSFKDSTELDSHKLLAHGETPKHFSCDICHQRFLSQGERDSHKAQHRKDEMHTCPMCSQEFFHTVELAQHLKEHSGDFPYKCNQCGKSFRLKLQLIQHIRLHIPQPPQPSLSGDKSGLQCDQKKDMDEHLTLDQAEADKFKCHLCSKVFQFGYKLQNHLRLHTNVRTFQCYLCHKSFATKHFLQRHLQIHLKEGMEVDINNIIKTETEEAKCVDNVPNEESNSNINVRASEDLQNSVSSVQRQSSKDLKEYEYRRFRSNKNMPRIDIQRVRNDASSDSEESASSVLTRESEKSDPFRFSSDGSDSFKFTMAKERRRLRKRRQLSRLALYNKLNALKMKQCHEEEEEIKIVQGQGPIEKDDCDKIQDMMVEINGVKSEDCNEITVFVELRDAKSPLELGLLSSQIVDATDKENQFPCLQGIYDSSDFLSRIRRKLDFQDEFGALSTTSDKGKTLVLDIEMNEDSLDSLLGQEEEDRLTKDFIDHSCPSGFGERVDSLKDSNTPASEFMPKYNHKSERSSQTRLDMFPDKSMFSPVEHLKVSSASCDVTKSGLGRSSHSQSVDYIKEEVLTSSLDSHVSKSSLQPLESLHVMTAQIPQHVDDNMNKPSTALQSTDERYQMNLKSSIHPTSNKSGTMINRQISPSRSSAVSSLIGSNNQANSSALQKGSSSKSSSAAAATECRTSENLKLHGSPRKGNTLRNSDLIKPLNTNPSTACHFEANKPFLPPSAIPHSHNSSPYHQSGNSQYKDRRPSQTAIKPVAFSSDLKKSPSSSFHPPGCQTQPYPHSTAPSLPCRNLSESFNIALPVPAEYSFTSMDHSIAKSQQASSHPCTELKSPVYSHSKHLKSVSQPATLTVNSKPIAICGSYTHSSINSSTLLTDSKHLQFSSALDSKPVISTLPNHSSTSDPSVSKPMFDTKDPTLRNINMMELVGQSQIQGGVSVATAPILPPCPPINMNTLHSQSQELNSGAASHFRPSSSASILSPIPLGSLPSSKASGSSSSIPSMSSNSVISSLPANCDLHLQQQNNFGNQPLSFGLIGPSVPHQTNLHFGLGNVSATANFGTYNLNSINPGMSGPSLPFTVGNICGLDPTLSSMGNIHSNPMSSFINNMNPPNPMASLGNMNPPMPFFNMDAMATHPSSATTAFRPTNPFNPINLLQFGPGGPGVGGFNPVIQGGIPQFNNDLNFQAAGTFLSAPAGSGSMLPFGASNLLSPYNTLPMGSSLPMPMGTSLPLSLGTNPSLPIGANPLLPLGANPGMPMGAVNFPLSMPVLPESGVFPTRPML